ncbi:hypothetical protein GALMADRAFT_146116 [Galerina marginata CBS 339.88]|uniref:Uncharacterized protein n=1 Tax=Galerina marginata (strain CBS 339.88) TaxID=685588 RepID=A0A067SPR0_GALM3|nr:hypothetical protein GALMADRAFT_146116 [Galerina marginata CBS 339.88]
MATTSIMEASSMTSSFMLPGMSSPEPDANGRVVRFDNECVLIQEVMQKRMPLMLTKSYSLPLWRRKGHPLSDSDTEDASGSSARSPSPEDSRVVLKVPIPLFRRRSSRSPTRGRSVSSSPVVPKTLPSCLVHRSPSASPIITRSIPLSPVRRPSLPVYQRRKDEVTVPLRACCEACERIMEESLKEGESWQEKFTKGAKRRRSASLETNDINSLFRLPSHARTSSFSKEFNALSSSLDNIGDSSRYGSTSTFTLTVDEVDKRRKSLDFSRELLEPFLAAPPSPSSPAFPSHGSLYSGHPRHPRSRPHERETSSNSSISSSSATEELQLPDILDPRHRLRSSPIEEEDEAQLFPLPSPRRSPSGTPSPSPSPRVSPVPSPNGSTSCLPAAVAKGLAASGRSVSASSSKESMASKNNNSQESLLKASLSRKAPAAYLAAPTMSTPRKVSPSPVTSLARSPSPLSSSTLNEIPNGATTMKISTHGLKITTAGERTPSSAMSPRGPRPPISATRERAGSAKPPPPAEDDVRRTEVAQPVPFVPIRLSDISKPTEAVVSRPLVPLRLSTVSSPSSTSSPIPIPGSQTSHATSHSRHASSPPNPSSYSQSHIPLHTRSTSASTASPTSPQSSSRSPVLGYQKRKNSFTLPFIKAGEALREVSVDVLKGVSSISSAGAVGSV